MLFSIQKISGKGFGAIADIDINEGEIILSERYIFSHKIGDADNIILDLDNDVYKLANSFPEFGIIGGIFLTNAYKINDKMGAIFPLLSRFNHSCIPNTYQYLDINRQKYTLVAIQNILKGEELTTSYLDHFRFNDMKKWQTMLIDKFRFECDCELCSGKAEYMKKLRTIFACIKLNNIKTENRLKLMNEFIDIAIENKIIPLNIIDVLYGKSIIYGSMGNFDLAKNEVQKAIAYISRFEQNFGFTRIALEKALQNYKKHRMNIEPIVPN